MQIHKAILNCVLGLLVSTQIPAQVVRGGPEAAGPGAARYVNPLPIEDARRIGDPVVIRFQDKYHLYMSGGLSWSSDDLVHWEHHQVSLPEGRRVVAPHALVYKDFVYLTGNNTGLLRGRHPLGPFEYIGDFTNEKGERMEPGGGVFDPMILVDEDGRVYLYYSGRSINGIYGVELDRDNLTKFAGPIHHLFRFDSSHFWERYGSRNEYSEVSWIEGPWMTKRNGKYYLQYSASGTDWKTYAVGVYTSSQPLGPFSYCAGSPILVHRNGMINGTAHHAIIEAPDGTLWAFSTLLYRNWNRMFERRIGLDPVGFDAQGNMFINGPSETPQWAPGVQPRPEWGNDSGSLILSEDKNYTVSSEAPGRDAPYAFDNNARTWWAPAENDPAPSLTLDLGYATNEDPRQEFIVDSARILFSIPPGRFTENGASGTRRYKIEASSDGEAFQTVVDKTANDRYNCVEFDEIAPVQTKFIRLTSTEWPQGVASGVVEFTVFGKPGPALPPRRNPS